MRALIGRALLWLIRAAVERGYEAEHQALFRATLDGPAQRGTPTATAARMIAARAANAGEPLDWDRVLDERDRVRALLLAGENKSPAAPGSPRPSQRRPES